MKPGDRVIWLRSPGRSFLSGWRVQAIPAVVVRLNRHRVKIRMKPHDREKQANVDPENVIPEEELREHETKLPNRWRKSD